MKTKAKKTAMNPSSDFWDGVRESAKQVQSGPLWMKAGITLNSANFNTFTPESVTLTASDKPSSSE